ncbi:arylamine N-acetyltransferase [Streptomyces sp. NPDC089919]|uniref:arylamine N-acetyltransferase family protein n=1 Tax=Streptomyces sp. NPDC089919 TaxID=3155188 RepID=UPI003438E43D
MWSGAELDLGAYLERIGYAGQPRPDARTLREVHRAHVRAIPFENLDVALGQQIELDIKSVEDKLVRSRRGGYCYEHSTLLAAALERIGFAVGARGARNRTRGDALTPVTHAVLVVAADGREWLADAGFGHQTPLEPIDLAAEGEVRQGPWTYAVGREADGLRVLRMRREDGWRDLYAFAPQPVYPVDFLVMNHWSGSHPRSHFVGQVVAQRADAEVRSALVRDQLTRLRPDGGTERRTVAGDEVIGLLAEEFGIELPGAGAAKLVATYCAGDRTADR